MRAEPSRVSSEILYRVRALQAYAQAYRKIAEGHAEAARAMRLAHGYDRREGALSEQAERCAEETDRRVEELCRQYWTAVCDERDERDERDDTPTATCPSCGAEQEDLDGFGVLACALCGYCEHPTTITLDGQTCCGWCRAQIGGGES